MIAEENEPPRFDYESQRKYASSMLLFVVYTVDIIISTVIHCNYNFVVLVTVLNVPNVFVSSHRSFDLQNNRL